MFCFLLRWALFLWPDAWGMAEVSVALLENEDWVAFLHGVSFLSCFNLNLWWRVLYIHQPVNIWLTVPWKEQSRDLDIICQVDARRCYLMKPWVYKDSEFKWEKSL